MDFKTEKKGYNRAQVDEYILNLVKGYEQTAARQSELIEQLKLRLAESEKKNKAYRGRESLISDAITSAVAKADEIDRLARLKYTREMEQLKVFHDKWLSYYERILKKYPLDADLKNAARFNDEMNRILEKAKRGSATDVSAPEEPEPAKEDNDRGKTGKETRIGYTVIDAEESGEEISGEGFLPGDFDPVDRIRSFLSKERDKRKEPPAVKAEKEQSSDAREETAGGEDYADRSESGFSFEEALHPKEDLADIMRDLGLLLDE